MHVSLRDGLQLHVRESGRGPAIVMLHGFSGSSQMWGDDLLDSLAARHRVLAVDLLGHGESDAPDDGSRYALGEMVRDICDLLDKVVLEAPAWIGYSMGGRIALGGAVQAPERVGRLVLESASPGLRDGGERRARRDRDAALGRRIIEEGIEQFVAEWEALPLFATRRNLDPAVRDELRAHRLLNRPAALAACLAGLGTGTQPSLWDALPSVAAETLLLTGAEDTKFGTVAERMAAALPRATHVTVPGVGHTVHRENPDAWLGAVEAFLSAVPRRLGDRWAE